MRIWIKNGRVIDPGRFEGVADILIENGQIAELIPEGEKNNSPKAAEYNQDRVINARNLLVVPGLIDMHVHLREPGQEYKETIETGTMAAAAGGFTAVCCMPNTQPANDCAQVTRFIAEKACKCGHAAVYPVGAMTMGLKGKLLAEYGDMKEAGAIAVSDDGHPVADSQVMRRALEYARGIGLPVISHCEEASLSCGVMNEGPVSTKMGLAGIPNAAESIMVMRDIALCALTKSSLHIAHVSTRESIDALRAAKKKGILVTAETAPHYFTITDESVFGYNTHAKMNPPLRNSQDLKAVRKGLADGTIDVIATDHAPHSVMEKQIEFDLAANGITGLETALPLGLALVSDGVLTLTALIEKMAVNPAKIIGLSRKITPGAPADLTIIDREEKFTYIATNGYSKSKNSPFDGWEFTGRAAYTISGGRITYERMNTVDG
ncbi:MAG: dihydroorotase [Deltaproteobacteria bacterium]|nr:dihydroorotase [Deltaproteobacteria bacterium]